MRLISAIDILDGDVVRLFQGDFERCTAYARDPLTLAREYAAAGAPDLHVVDLNAARGDVLDNYARVEELARESGVPMQVGGGVRDEERLLRLLNAGATRAVIGSLAVTEPARVQGWMAVFGAERIVVALDVRPDASGRPRLLTHGWRDDSGESLWRLLDAYVGKGLRHLLCTDASRDGTLAGPNVALYREILSRYPEIELQASGGIGNQEDIVRLKRAKVPAAILGRALLEGRVTLHALREAVT